MRQTSSPASDSVGKRDADRWRKNKLDTEEP